MQRLLDSLDQMMGPQGEPGLRNGAE